MPANYFYMQPESTATELAGLSRLPALTRIKILCSENEKSNLKTLPGWVKMKALEYAGLEVEVSLATMEDE